MGQELSHISASERLEAELGIEGPFYIPSAGHADQSMQRIVCLVSSLCLITSLNLLFFASTISLFTVSSGFLSFFASAISMVCKFL